MRNSHENIATRERSLPSLKALLAFEAAARLGSFTQAAQELHVTQTAISHQVRQLEEFYALSLFDRAGRRIALTAAGERLQHVATDLFDTLDRQTRDIRHPGGRDAPLRITLPPALGARWLAPRLGEFWAQHRIALNLIPGTALLDFQRDDIDVGIRCGAGHWPGLEAEFLLPLHLTPVCAPALLERGRGRHGADVAALVDYTLLHEISYDAWGEWLAARGLEHIPYRQGTICQDSAMLIDVAIRGQGVALVSASVLTEELRAGTLVAPFGLHGSDADGYYLVYRKASLADPKVRLFRDFVMAQTLQTAGR